MSFEVNKVEIKTAPPWMWPWKSTQSQTYKHTKYSKKQQQKTQTLPPCWWSLYTHSSPAWMSNQWEDTGNATHGWPYKAVRKLLIPGFRAQSATPFSFTSIAAAPLPLLPTASCLYQLIFHTEERPVPRTPQRPSPSMNSQDNKACLLSSWEHLLYAVKWRSCSTNGKNSLYMFYFFIIQNVLQSIAFSFRIITHELYHKHD